MAPSIFPNNEYQIKEAYSELCQTSKMECFTKKNDYFLKKLSWFSEWYSGTFNIGQTDHSIHSKLRIFPLFRNHSWKYNIQTNKGKQRLKKHNYPIRCVWSFFHFLHCNGPDNKCCKQKWGVLFFTHIKLVARITRIKWIRLILYIYIYAL